LPLITIYLDSYCKKKTAENHWEMSLDAEEEEFSVRTAALFRISNQSGKGKRDLLMLRN